MNNNDSTWFICRNTRKLPKIKLFCFPYAGGGSSIYRDWELNNDIELHAALLPGREQRFTEPPIHSMDELISKLSEAMYRHLDLPFAFFGHSMGALIAYELAKEMQRLYGIPPIHLFVSGKSAPQLGQRQPLMHNLHKDKFMERLISLGGIPKEIIEYPSVFEFYEPIIRSDFKLYETYIFNNREQLRSPISILAGYQDELVSIEGLEKWNELTTGPVSLNKYTGGHFFIRTHRDKIQQLINNSLITKNVILKS